MPARHFDGRRFRAERRKRDLLQGDIADPMDVASNTIGSWENGKSHPDPEKLPALARILGMPLNQLFPRVGDPDLADLRCDAGYPQYKTGEFLGGRSHQPVSKAERGLVRLDPSYIEPLAKAYGVTEEELLAAQERSFGKEDPAVREHVPQTLAEKITYVLDRSYPSGEAPTDAQLARSINDHLGGAATLSADEVAALRTGTEASAAPEVLDAVAASLGVSPLFFQPATVAVQQVLEGLRFLASIRNGQVLGLAARGGELGLDADTLGQINELIAHIQEEPGNSRTD